MRRTPIVRKTPMRPGGAIARSSSGSSTFTRKRKGPKRPDGYADRHMRNACANQPCYLRYPGICCNDPRTAAPAHSNEGAHGKGGALKARDRFTLPACWRCHAEHDQGKRFTFDEKCTRWRAGYREWAPRRAQILGIQLEATDVDFTETPL